MNAYLTVTQKTKEGNVSTPPRCPEEYAARNRLFSCKCYDLVNLLVKFELFLWKGIISLYCA
jgi:hypothetical protein